MTEFIISSSTLRMRSYERSSNLGQAERKVKIEWSLIPSIYIYIYIYIYICIYIYKYIYIYHEILNLISYFSLSGRGMKRCIFLREQRMRKKLRYETLLFLKEQRCQLACSVSCLYILDFTAHSELSELSNEFFNTDTSCVLVFSLHIQQ